MTERLNRLLAELRTEAAGLQPEEVPGLVGALETVKAAALLQLMRIDAVSEGDRLLSVEDVAERLGVSARWVYEHQDELPRSSLSPRCLRFSENELQRWMAKKKD